MVGINDFKQIEPYLYEIPSSFRSDMRVPARFYLNAELIEGVLGDKSLEQLVNVATLPGIVKYSLAMPDIHQGYGFPIGGVAATESPHGVISPGGVGYDINCGVRLLASKLHHKELLPHLESLADALNANCPSGVGKGGSIRLQKGDLSRIAHTGSQWALKQGYATKADLEHTEENGCMAGADIEKVSPRAKERGKTQVGTLGAGNHFIEVDTVDFIADETAAQVKGLFPEQIVVQIHCGSRGFGHQICSDYVKRFQKAIVQYQLSIPDRELVCAPLNTPEGQDYFAAMKAAANFAFVNRQVLVWHIRRSFEAVLSGKDLPHAIFQIYDIAHNMAKLESHEVDGRIQELCVHRKGATRAFGPGSKAIPAMYRDIGQPVLVPGSMGTASWVLVGTRSAMQQTFGSTCHGAGRVMSRHKAKKQVRGAKLREELKARGIITRCGSLGGLAEEAPAAYKDIAEVVNVVAGAGIARKVARLKPLVVIKG
jgi:tRNA-splicing ligase RtcB